MPAGSQAKLPTPAGPQPVTSSYGATGRSAARGSANKTAIRMATMIGMRMGGMLTRLVDHSMLTHASHRPSSESASRRQRFLSDHDFLHEYVVGSKHLSGC